MNIHALDAQQLKVVEERLFDEFTALDRVLAAEHEKMTRIEALLTQIVALRREKETGNQEEEEEVVEDPRPITPPVYSEDRINPPEVVEEGTWTSGPFQIRKTPSGEVDTVVCDLGQWSLLVERDGSTARWRIQPKHLVPLDILRLMSPESMDSSP